MLKQKRTPQVTVKPATYLAQKTCKACKQKFTPNRPMQKACGWECAEKLVATDKARRAAKAELADRKLVRAKLATMKTKAKLIAEAQVVFNRFIRLRDAGLPCICCGKPMGAGVVGGAIDAGHYRSRGSAPHLRFNELNVHAQRKQCNRYESGNAHGYRAGLIARLGAEVVESLDCDETPKHYTDDDLRAIKTEYRRKATALEKSRG